MQPHRFAVTRPRLIIALIFGVLVTSGCDEDPGRDTTDQGGVIDAAVQDAAVQDAALDGLSDLSTDSAADGATDSATDLPPTTKKTSLTQYGITWTFDKAYPCGQFVSGDWWVLGPLKVVSVTPKPTGSRNGSMLDPVGAQAYDARGGSYKASKAVSFPLQLTGSGTHSLVSSISHPDTAACTQGSSPGWLTYDGVCQRGPIATQAILTVLAQAPPSSSFRPPYAGAAKPLHAASGVCWKALPQLPVPAGAPAAAKVLRHVERPWIDHLQSWTMQHGCATLNMYCYGREVGNTVSTVSMYVLLKTPQQQTLATRLIQLGIDNHGVLKAGGGWGGDGGHFNGRKWPIVFAGALLGEAGMKSPGIDIGNEDRMTYLGQSGKSLWGRACTDCYFPNGCKYGGTCTKGAKDCRDPAKLVDGCSDYRNCCTSVTWVGEALAARIMGLTAAWGHAPFFAYVDRWMKVDVPGGGGTTSPFVTGMWSTYRNNLPTPGSCP
jgi:hypothetical protein